MKSSIATKEPSVASQEKSSDQPKTGTPSPTAFCFTPVIPNSPNSASQSSPNTAASFTNENPTYSIDPSDIRDMILDLNPLSEQDNKNTPIKKSYEFSPQELELLIKAKKRKRNIDCRVVVGDLEKVFKQLQAEKENKKINLPHRVQIVYKRTGKDEFKENYVHWTALDILISENKMKVFYLDAGGDDVNLGPIKNAVLSVPNCELTCCGKAKEVVTKTELIDGKEVMTSKVVTYNLQKDHGSCSIFAIDHAFHMSKIDNLHDYIDTVRKAGKDFYVVHPFKLPPILVKNAQSRNFINLYLKQNKNRADEIVNKKQQTLLQYANAHILFYPKAKIYINTGVQYKQIQYAKKIKQFQKTLMEERFKKRPAMLTAVPPANTAKPSPVKSPVKK